uniref:(northern house mosquito) hypothetical protein n=1 Tax=Culex pipiens TaxID=7175 RepID=A0A8D8C731_CULPI
MCPCCAPPMVTTMATATTVSPPNCRRKPSPSRHRRTQRTTNPKQTRRTSCKYKTQALRRHRSAWWKSLPCRCFRTLRRRPRSAGRRHPPSSNRTANSIMEVTTTITITTIII